MDKFGWCKIQSSRIQKHFVRIWLYFCSTDFELAKSKKNELIILFCLSSNGR